MKTDHQLRSSAPSVRNRGVILNASLVLSLHQSGTVALAGAARWSARTAAAVLDCAHIQFHSGVTVSLV